MPLIVQKFGGTSVGTPERIQLVADRIAECHAQGNRVVTVVSAMGHTTDELLELAHRVSKNPPHREIDMLLTAGERISMALLSMALADRKIPALSFTGSQSGILTDPSHRRARILKIKGDRVREALDAGKVAIVAGFQGVSEAREITTLGRGGSDTTAVALAAALGAELCEIYTDVDGVYSADPRIVPDARLWKTLSHELMTELAVLGAGVLHPRSVELAKRYGVRLKVRNSRNQTEGTEIMTRVERGMEDFEISGVTADSTKALVIVELMRATVAGSIWDLAAGAHLAIVAPLFADEKVYFYADRDAESDWKRILARLSNDGFVKSFQFDLSYVPVSVVGDRFAQDGSALSEVFDALTKVSVTTSLGTASALSMTFAVRANQSDVAVQAIHARFFTDKKET